MATSWGAWYEPGTAEDDVIYMKSLKNCRRVNEQLNAQPWWDSQAGPVAPEMVKSAPERQKQPTLYNEKRLSDLIKERIKAIENNGASKPEWKKKINNAANQLIAIATRIKPAIDVFIPQSPEYSIPYACLWAIFKGVSDRNDKIDSIQDIITSLSYDIPVLEALKGMFPTTDMKEALAEFYIHTLDLLWKLSMYLSHNYFKQLADAFLPRTKYKFPIYHKNVEQAATRLKTLCKIGHYAEQKEIKQGVEDTKQGVEDTKQSVEDTRQSVDVLNYEIYLLKRKLQDVSLAQSRISVSEILDTWDNDTGDVENEFRKWQSLRFFTDMRDHWSQNGVLPRLMEWREFCDASRNSIFWISTDDNGRQFWLTEFSINLITICRSQDQLIAFAMCDRPEGVKWTPQLVLKQLILQLLNARPTLAISAPHIFNSRKFRKSKTFDAILNLLHSIVAQLKSVVIVIDQLDKCIPDPDAYHANIADALSTLVKMHPLLRIIVTTGRVVPPSALPGRPISFTVVNTKRRPRVLEFRRTRIIHHEEVIEGPDIGMYPMMWREHKKNVF